MKSIVVCRKNLKKDDSQPLFWRGDSRGAPDGHVYTSNSHGKLQYYIRDDFGNKTYLARDSEIVASLLQKNYDEKCMKANEKRLKATKSFLKFDSDKDFDDIYNDFDSRIQKMISPVTETKEQLIERIRNEKYEGLGFPLGYPVFLTSDGRRVRSKSEMMIGDVLENSNVLNQYEKPLDLGRYGKVYPDYTIYDLNRNRIVYWEHFGMIDNPEYANKCVEKYRKYILSGITPFVTFGTAIKPLSIDLIKKIAWNFSLDNYDDQ